MHPSAIVRAAVEAGLDGVVICDHNAADNVAAAGRAARAAGCLAVPGMEITTEEEVHLVALLPDEAAAGVLHARVAAALPGRNAPAAFGEQVIANEDGEVMGFNASLLAGATSWTVGRAADEIHRAGGLVVAAHVDRERFGMVGQLGFVPADLALDAIEVSAATAYDAGRRRYADPLGLPAITGSDAHGPGEIGRALTYLHLDHAEAAEVHRAIRAEGGRAVLGGGRPMEDLALHILDIARNGAEAGATRIESPGRGRRGGRHAPHHRRRQRPRDGCRDGRPRDGPVLHDPPDARGRAGAAAAAPGRRGGRRRAQRGLTAWHGHARGRRVRARPRGSRTARRRGNHRPGAAGVAPGCRPRLDAPARTRTSTASPRPTCGLRWTARRSRRRPGWPSCGRPSGTANSPCPKPQAADLERRHQP